MGLDVEAAVEAAGGMHKTPPTADECKAEYLAFERADLERRAAYERLKASDCYKFLNNRQCPIFEVYTDEFIEALATYIASRLDVYKHRCPLSSFHREPVQYTYLELVRLTVLEVGAGDGRLSYLLEKRLAKLYKDQPAPDATSHGASGAVGARLVAVDPSPHPYDLGNCLIDAMEPAKAMETHRPVIVIMCWMPGGRDFTAQMRRCDSCFEYILIGPTDGLAGAGHEWLTWGRGVEAVGGAPPPYEADGWTRHDIGEVSRWQLSRLDLAEIAAGGGKEGGGGGEEEEGGVSSVDLTDTGTAPFVSKSATVSFRRSL